jgi:coenzyme Q-binding protein COQ10
MAGASRSIVINVPPEKLFDVVTDYESYAEFLPEVKSVRVERAGPSVSVHYEVNLVKTIKYSLKMTEERPTRVRWSLIKGDFMKENNGSWELKPAGEGKTEATYNIEVGVGPLVPKTITSMLVDKSLPSMLEAFKKRAENR